MVNTNANPVMRHLNMVDDDTAMNIMPKFGVMFEPLGYTLSVQDSANLFQPQYTQKTTLVPSTNIQLSFKGFDSYATMHNPQQIAVFIADQQLDSYDESLIIDACRKEMMKGHGIVYGIVSYLNGETNRVVGHCYGPVFYSVKPDSDTHELLPIDVVTQYIHDTYNASFNAAVNWSTSANPKRNFNKLASLAPLIKSKTAKTVGLVSMATLLITGSAYAIYKNSANPGEIAAAASKPSDTEVATPSQALKNMSDSPVMLLNTQGDKVEQTNTEKMANLQVTTTENYLKKMGVDLNKKSDLSCLE